MNKIILTLFALCLMSCQQEVKLNESNHLHLFNLKGKVKQINYDYILNEITDISYKPTGKANPRFLDLGSISETDLSYLRAFSNFGFYSSKLPFFDSYNISIDEILSKSYDAERCDNYEITFNENGFVTNFKGFKDKLLLTNTTFKYDGNKLISVKKREGFKDSNLYNYDITFDYNENELLSSRIKKHTNGKYSESSIFDYKFDSSKNEFSVKEAKSQIINKKDKRNIESTYLLILDSNNEIVEIKDLKQEKSIKIQNGNIKNVKDFNDNKLTFNLDFDYNKNNITSVKKTEYENLNELYFEYEENGNLKSVKCNDESKKDYINNLKFNYEFDEFKNWTKQSYSIDRTKYDNYLQYLKKREKYSNDYYELYGYSPFSFQEDVDAEIERKLLSKYSSKIDVERRIIYY